MNQETDSPSAEPAPPALESAEPAPHPLERAKALLARLIQTYPAAFFAGGVKRIPPLKIGVYKELLPISSGWGHDAVELKVALRYYTRSLRYQLALLKAPQRVDLLGEPAGEITAAHRQIAQEKVDQIMAKRKQQQPERRPEPRRERRPESGPGPASAGDRQAKAESRRERRRETAADPAGRAEAAPQRERQRREPKPNRSLNEQLLAALQEKLSTKALP